MKFKVNVIGEIKYKEAHGIVQIINCRYYNTAQVLGKPIKRLHYIVRPIKVFRATKSKFMFKAKFECIFTQEDFEKYFIPFESAELIYA